MIHYKKVAKYWRNALVDQLFSKGKYKETDLSDSFIHNIGSLLHRVDSKNNLQSLLSSFDVDFIEGVYVPFYFRKIAHHKQYERDYRPEVFFPFTIKVQVSKSGFIYPIENPVVPRDLLLPLDKDDFYLGLIEDYDSLLAQETAELFEYTADLEWEKYYQEHIENEYNESLLAFLKEKQLVSANQTVERMPALLNSLLVSRMKKNEFKDALKIFNENWDQHIVTKLTTDKDFNQSIQRYHEKWSNYIAFVYQVWCKVITFQEHLVDYQRNEISCITTMEVDASAKIVAVYEDLYETENNLDLALFENYTCFEQQAETAVLNSANYFSQRLGHNNNLYPLADAQRLAVSSILAAKHGDILPVNGPPGTGKTTMLLSVVACLWVEHAVRGMEPPVIIANSTNNQAVTNIIDAFAKDFSNGEGVFAGRWIDELNSFGSYFVSGRRQEQANEKGYVTENSLKVWETDDFYIKALDGYLNKAQEAFQNNCKSVQEVVNNLHKLLTAKKGELIKIENSYKSYHDAGKEIGALLTFDYRDEERVKSAAERLAKTKEELVAIANKWIQYLASEHMMWAAFSFIPFIKRKRNLKAKVFAKELHFDDYLNIESLNVDDFEDVIEKAITDTVHKIEKLNNFLELATTCTENLHRANIMLSCNADFIEIDRIADTKNRFEMFLLATHYWEGKWLLDMEQMILNDEIKKIGWTFRSIREANWKRRMKLTPCAVMTSYMLPGFFSYTRKLTDEVYKKEYLYNFIDLLIIDEAGQVSPEVAGAGFAMAKRALVIGDTLQIPPIYKLTKSIDIGNLHKSHLLPSHLSVEEIDNKYEVLQAKGSTSNGGSVMKVAQNRSAFYPEKELERGLYLYEHRRCYNSIIDYCNQLCYKGVLIPMRGDTTDNAIFPSMGYLNIEGKCEDAAGSKRNDVEAKVIARWIINQYDNLKQGYPEKDLKDIIAVVTPFREQSRLIKQYLRHYSAGKDTKEFVEITVGTVHSLQGAERSVVLFSPTYSKHKKGGFIDNDRSMLNVAVSRAKDSFLVFGDMSIFNRSLSTPSGLLAKYLFKNTNNELHYGEQYSDLLKREDLISPGFPTKLLTNHNEHDVFLKQMFECAKERLVIISPWIIYSTMEKNGYDKLIADKKTKVIVYTDEKFNTYQNNLPNKDKKESFQLTVERLTALGVEVRVMNNVHSKIVIKDNDCMCIGSFNWFSAQRGGKYANMEHSIVYEGENVKEEIDNILKALSI